MVGVRLEILQVAYLSDQAQAERSERICAALREEGDALVLERLHVMPAWQGRGLGTKLLRAFVERASREGRAARLQVFRTNPARALYARIGFQTIDVGENHETMEWAPPS